MLGVEGLASHYGRIRALDGVTLSVGEGELVALIGANGAGKTTLLRAVSGVQPASAGRVLFRGQDITAMAAERRVRLGIAQVPEGRQVFAPMTVEDNLRLGAFTRPGGEVAAGLDRAFGLFPRLRERRRQLAGTLSGGEQQMLAIGRALMSGARLLLLDEPSMGLAPRLVEQILDTLRLLRGQGMTILLVEQNAMAALGIADRGYVLETGRVVLDGQAPSLLRDEQVGRAYLGL